MNISNLQILLQEAIDNATATVDYLLLAKAIQSLNVGQIRTVATYANLPSAAANEGLLMFVTADERLYWSNGSNWYNLISESTGLAYSWGCNVQGQMGDGTVANKSSPVSVLGGFTDWCQLVVGCAHSLGIRSNGTAWAWGCNSSGELGNNSTIDRSSPVSIVGGFTDWCQVNTGWNHSVGIRTNGTAWVWGLNTNGQLGTNSTVSTSSPVSVVGGFTDWCQVSAGSCQSIGLRSNGTVWTWGCNGNGRLGDNSTIDRSSPVSVVGGFTNWCQISGGAFHNLGVRTNGTAWAWGFGGNGQLGDGTAIWRSSPVSVAGGFANWCQVSGGANHSLGVRTNGQIWAWGLGNNGRIGDNSIITKSSPVSVVGGFTNWCQVSAGHYHSIGLQSNGTVWAWGYNGNGELGNNGPLVNRSSPVSVVGGFTDWCQIEAGRLTSLGIRGTGFV